MMIRIPTRLALAAAVSALALTGSAAAQQNQQNQQNQQQSQQRQQAQQQRGQMPAQQRQAQQRQSQSAPMEYRQVRGTVVDAKRVNVRGSQQPATVVLLEMQNGQRAVVDLGTERLGIRLRQGSELAVRGRPVNVGDQKVILQADAVNYEGRTYDVNRPAKQAMSGNQQRQSMNQQSRTRQQGGNRQQANLQLGPYDANNDAQFSLGEISRALYDRFDRNRNGTLSIAEWDRGMDRMFGEGDINLSVATWDPDGNDRITRREFQTAMRKSGLYQRIDADRSGGITRVEITEARTGLGDRTSRIIRSADRDDLGDGDVWVGGNRGWGNDFMIDEEAAEGGLDRAPFGTPGVTDADDEISPFGIEANPSAAQLDVLEDEDDTPPKRDLSTMSGGG